jgi:hypothetical protein
VLVLIGRHGANMGARSSSVQPDGLRRSRDGAAERFDGMELVRSASITDDNVALLGLRGNDHAYINNMGAEKFVRRIDAKRTTVEEYKRAINKNDRSMIIQKYREYAALVALFEKRAILPVDVEADKELLRDLLRLNDVNDNLYGDMNGD